MDYPIQITLKNGIIKPNSITMNISENVSHNSPSILLRVGSDKSQSYTNLSTSKKYIFVIEETDEETQPLSQGQQYLFKNWSNCKSGVYHLVCVNYPKLSCDIQIINQQTATVNQRKSNTIINLSGLQSVQEKQQQNKQDFGKQENQWVKSQQQISQNPLGTPKKAQISDYDRILLEQNKSQQTIENRYLRYFQQEFKIWRNFFQQKQQQQNQEPIQVEQSTPIKQKPKSEQRKNSEVMQIQQNKIDAWSKRQNYSPDLKFTFSCGSPSNNQNLSQFQKEKDKSVLSHLHSQDNYRNDDELQKQVKTMKKTNSEYRLNIHDIGQKKDSQADTASKKKLKICKNQSFIQWLDNWAQTQQILQIKQKEDENIVRQWLGHLQNKFKISKFLYG